MICSILFVKRSPSLPAFDERIIRDTELDVEWIMELRYSGFSFSVLSHGWFIDVKDYKFVSVARLIRRDSLRKQARSSRLYGAVGVSPKLVRTIRQSIPRKYKGKRVLATCPKLKKK